MKETIINDKNNNNQEVIVDRKHAYDNIGINQVVDIRNNDNNKLKDIKKVQTRHIHCQKDKNVIE